MRLASLLAELNDADLDRLAREHVRTDDRLPRAQLCLFLEGAINSYPFVNSFITNRQPPTFAILATLLDTDDHALPHAAVIERARQETSHLTELIRTGELLERADGLRLYRRAFYEARRNDLDLNGSEAAILSVLRQECRVSQVEHFLLEHHEDFHEFWRKDGFLAHEELALRAAGILFSRGSHLMIPEELVPAVRQTLGIDMPTEGVGRLVEFLSNAELATALEASGIRASGNRQAKVERLLISRLQPHAFLHCVGVGTLREVCRTTGASPSGNKDDLIEKIISHFAQGKDQPREQQAEPPKREDRALSQSRFEMLFAALNHREISDILRRNPDLRQSGTKQLRIRALWEAHLSEVTFLSELMNRDLEDVLARLGLKLGGSKPDRIGRLIDHFSQAPAETALSTQSERPRDATPADAELAESQMLFRQKASSPQASLQPWLETLLGAAGRIRCYATEDTNPTKQLKNKLSQAAAVGDGLLVLILLDKSAYLSARDALVNRWMSNPEWPKTAGCVALAYPLGAASIETIVERTRTALSRRLTELVAPRAEVVSVMDPSAAVSECSSCHQLPPRDARFCPSCGQSL